MFVAIPTAMPLEPLTRRFGNFEGRTSGSFSVPPKLSIQSTVSFSRSSSIASAVFARRHSLDRIAAGSPCVLLDVLPAGLDGFAHEDREQGISGRGVLDRHLLQ